MTEQVQEVKQEPRKLKLYKHVMNSAQYVFGCFNTKDETTRISGRVAAFVRHLYATDDPDEIAELDHVIASYGRNGTKYIYVDPDQEYVDESYLDPQGALKLQIREEVIQELRAQNRLKDFGETEDKPMLKGVAGTSRLVPGAQSISGAQGQVQVSKPSITPGKR